MKLTEEKKSELREVKECCKVNLPEFKERYNNLNNFDKIVVYTAVIDEDYEFDDDETLDEKINEEVLKFLREDKETAKVLLNALHSDGVIKDKDDNEYDMFNLSL